MPRIRSVHPTLFTDEKFVQASANARLLQIGIWTQAFDDGVFEWKPLTFKIRLFPVDDVDVAQLLQELENLDFVTKFEADGKTFGAIRNFQKFQRPKKPTWSGMLPAGLYEFVGCPKKRKTSVANRFGAGSQFVEQREEGEEKESTATSSFHSEEAAAAAAAVDGAILKRQCEEAAGAAYASGFGKILELVRAGVDVEKRLLPIVRAAAAEARERKQKITSWGWFAAAVADETRNVANPTASTDQIWCSARSSEFQAGNLALISRGEKPRVPISTKSRDGKGSWFDRNDVEKKADSQAVSVNT